MMQRAGFSFKEMEQRYGVSHWTFRRKADAGLLRTIYIGSRRLVPVEEVQRIDREGLPLPKRVGSRG